jgi:tRNA A-37 threonylcarbamoyl transferase component Bud32
MSEMALGQGESGFDCWWQRQGEWVETPNQRRGGESGVQRLRADDGRLCYAKRQIGHTYRSLSHPFGRPTVLREAQALQAWAGLGVLVPHVLYVGTRRATDGQWEALLVTEALEGFIDIERWCAEGGRERHGEAVHRRLLEELGRVLARLHAANWQHGCLYPKHILIRVTGSGDAAQVQVALLDLEKSRRRLSRKRAVRHDFDQLKRHSSWGLAEWSHLLYGYNSSPKHGRAAR